MNGSGGPLIVEKRNSFDFAGLNALNRKRRRATTEKHQAPVLF